MGKTILAIFSNFEIRSFPLPGLSTRCRSGASLDSWDQAKASSTHPMASVSVLRRRSLWRTRTTTGFRFLTDCEIEWLRFLILTRLVMDVIPLVENNLLINTLQVFEKNGTFRYQFGIPGKEEGQLWYPRKVNFYCDTLLILLDVIVIWMYC